MVVEDTEFARSGKCGLYQLAKLSKTLKKMPTLELIFVYCIVALALAA